MSCKMAVLLFVASSAAGAMMKPVDMEEYETAKALKNAACDGDEAAVRSILSKGFDLDESYNRSAADKGLKCARKKGYDKIAQWIEKAQAGERVQSAEEEAARRSAEAADKAKSPKEALQLYLDALDKVSPGSGLDIELREKIIKLARSMAPPPAVPEEARHHANRGAIYIKKAQDESDYASAISELAQASRMAPWWPDAYFNLGLAQEKAKQYDAAISSMKLYLLAAPDAQDAKAVQNKIDELIVDKERAAKRAEAAQEEEEEGPAR